MAIDTETKRRSVQAYTLGLMRPLADGAVDAGDRATAAWLYSGLSYSGAPPPPAATPTPDRRRGAMYPGGWVPDRLYTPPRKKLKKKALAELKELYEEAREVIPEALQVGLVPASVTLRARASVSLPPPSEINFDALSRSLETIRVIVAAIEEQQRIKKRRRNEDEMILQFLMQIED